MVIKCLRICGPGGAGMNRNGAPKAGRAGRHNKNAPGRILVILPGTNETAPAVPPRFAAFGAARLTGDQHPPGN